MRYLLTIALMVASGCIGDTDPEKPRGSSADVPTVAFEPVLPRIYVAKVKGLLTGLPPDDAELRAVSYDHQLFRPLVGQWLQSSQAQNVILDFFTTAFQQKNLSAIDFADQLGGQACGGWWILEHEDAFIGRGQYDLYNVNARYVDEFTQSFARTAWQLLMVENQPFTSVLTTHRFMLTPTMVAAMLYFDRFRIDNHSYTTDPAGIQTGGCGDAYWDVYTHRYPNEVYNSWQVTSGGPIDIADTLNASDANFMHWFIQGVRDGAGPSSYSSPVQQAGTDAIYLMLNGLAYSENPNAYFWAQVQPQWADGDFNTWRMVTVTQAAAADAPMRFWDLPAMRTITELPLMMPRVGFFTTPAFFGNWLTNQSNQFRVTANQALIVALGQSLLDADVIVRSANSGADENAGDSAHLSNSGCSSCHVILDPLRRFWSQVYDPTYQDVQDPCMVAQHGAFLLDGADQSGQSLDDLAQILANHPDFPSAWVNKVCQWANSAPCDPTDPEFLRIAANFKANNFNFRAMLQDVLSSPLVTGATATQTWQNGGEPVSISRYTHFCASLSSRVGVQGACSLSDVAAQNASNIPVDNYARGSSQPYLPSRPSLFFRTAVENLCSEVAGHIVDVAAPNNTYSSANDAAVSASVVSMVTSVMAIGASDMRYAGMVALLRKHYDDAVQSGAASTDALKSTFVVACTAPSSVSIGL